MDKKAKSPVPETKRPEPKQGPKYITGVAKPDTKK